MDSRQQTEAMVADVKIRTIKRDEVEIIYKYLAEIEKWPITLEELIVAFDHMGEGKTWFGAEVNGKLIGSISVVEIDNVAFGSLFFVHPDFRGKKIGRLLWDHRLRYINSKKLSNFIITAVQNRVEWNSSNGFPSSTIAIVEVVGTFQPDKFKTFPIGDSCSGNHLDIEVSKGFNSLSSSFPSGSVQSSSWEDVKQYDANIYPLNRATYIENLFKSTKDIIFAVARTNHTAVGYACIYPWLGGYVIAPIYANSEEIAHGLMARLSKEIEKDKQTALFTFKEGKLAEYLVKEHGFTAPLEATRQNHLPPAWNEDTIYGKVYGLIFPNFVLF